MIHNISNQQAYRILMDLKDGMERDCAAHYRINGHDADFCIQKARINDVNNQLEVLKREKING